MYAADFGATGGQVGILIASYSLVQLFMAPLWGRISDRVGRKPILLVGLFGSAAAYLIFALSGSLAALFAHRLAAAIGGSTVPVAEAYIADSTAPERRAGGLGLIGVAFGTGFVIGPALGSILGGRSIDVFGTPVIAAGALAFALCVANGIFASIFLPESRRPGPGPPKRRVRVSGSNRQIFLAISAYFLTATAFSVLQPTLSLLGKERFGMGPGQVGFFFSLVGVSSAFVQGALVRFLAPRVGEKRLLLWSAAPFAAGLLAIGYSSGLGGLLAGLALTGIGYGLAIPAALSTLSRATGAHAQGTALGIAQSAGSSARILGPLIAGFLFDVGMGYPYLVGAALAVAVSIFATRLTAPAARP